jgi:hypothetical protein
MGAHSTTDRSLVSTPWVSTPFVAPIPAAREEAAQTGGRAHRRRISPEAGHALEILGHAIEYLSDEFVHAGGSLTAHDAQVEAVQLLMGINRQIYFECPVVPSFGERCLALLHGKTASSS